MPSPTSPLTALHDVFVFGASAGGLQALRAIASRLPPSFGAAMLVVLHTGAHPTTLPAILERAGPNPARRAVDGEPLQAGQIVVAAPDQHLLLLEGVVRLKRGPKEHYTRPAIDPLFRSAALWGGPRVVGVLLSGTNDDGSAGLASIKACGGIAVVQDPADAEESTMPRSALHSVAVDYCLPAEAIAPLLVDLAGKRAGAALPAPPALLHEQALSLGEGNAMDNLRAIGQPSPLSCPECGGTLFAIDGTPQKRYRCHTGHAFSLRSLQQAQSEATEEALWSGVRALQEKDALLRRVAEIDRLAGDEARANQTELEAHRAADHAAALRVLLEEEPPPTPLTEAATTPRDDEPRSS